MSESDPESEYPEWAQEYIDDDDDSTEKYDPLPEWALDEGFSRTNRTCPRCHGDILKHHEVSYEGFGESVVMFRCSKFEHGCDYDVEVSPTDEYE